MQLHLYYSFYKLPSLLMVEIWRKGGGRCLSPKAPPFPNLPLYTIQYESITINTLQETIVT